MNETLKTIARIGIIPVIALDDARKAVPLAKALVAGGLPAAEITFRTSAAEEAIRTVSEEVPEMLVGAGTVTTPEQLDRALLAGSRFIVSPGFNPDMVRYGLSKGALMLPGTATGGEMEQAMALGLEVVKFFPAEENGGVKKLKAFAGPYRNLRWMPTGGVNTKNLMDYLSFDQILACGGTWMVKKDLIEGEQWDTITAICRDAVRTMLGISLSEIRIHSADAAGAGTAQRTLQALFDLPEKEVPPVTVTEGPAEIVLNCNSVDRAVYHLGRRGLSFEEESLVLAGNGKPLSIRLSGSLLGFSVLLKAR